MNHMKTKGKIGIACLITVCVITLYSGISHSEIQFGKHDLTEVGGAGGSNFKFTTGNADFEGIQTCVFCHTPHRANPNVRPTTVYNGSQYVVGSGAPMLLWNRSLSNQTTYSVYTSSSMTAPTTEVRAYSLLCLSCHDGISALNVLYNYPGSDNAPLTPYGGNFTMLANACNPYVAGWSCNIGDRLTASDPLNLSNDHPVSFDYTVDGGLVTPNVGGWVNTPVVRLFPNPQTGLRTSMECSTCHDPHGESDDASPKDPFLVVTKVNSALCTNCHIK